MRNDMGRKLTDEERYERLVSKLPGGLQEFAGSLWGEKWTEELLKRLLDLPRSEHLKAEIEAWKMADEFVRLAEEALRAAKWKANTMAGNIFHRCIEKYTVKQLQKATGYTDE